MMGLWKALPESVRAFAHRSRQAVQDAATPMLVAPYWRPGHSGGAPVTLVGFFGSVIGIGQGARLFLAAAEGAGVAVDALDAGAAATVSADLPDAPELADRAGPPAAGGTLITCFNPPELRRWLQRGGARRLKGRRHVGYWAWELPEVPADWRGAFRYVDEVWCPSRFTAEAIRAAAPSRVPVRVLGHPMHARPRHAADRVRFGLPDDTCVVLAALDLKSTSERKNPLGAMEAYRRAAPVADGRAVLVCKVTGGARWPERLAELEGAAGGRDDIRLLVEDLSDADMGRLVASADVIVSLHRAEGFGLLAAEGLCDGKAVVATAWSGVMDFLDADSSALVPWRPAEVKDAQGIYTGGWWADPDLDAAAARLRELIADAQARTALGARAAARAAVVFDGEAWRARFAALLAGRDPDPP
jgi:glycosyltransferase involved in cell wall biosynthesis